MKTLKNNSFIGGRNVIYRFERILSSPKGNLGEGAKHRNQIRSVIRRGKFISIYVPSKLQGTLLLPSRFLSHRFG